MLRKEQQEIEPLTNQVKLPDKPVRKSNGINSLIIGHPHQNTKQKRSKIILITLALLAVLVFSKFLYQYTQEEQMIVIGFADDDDEILQIVTVQDGSTINYLKQSSTLALPEGKNTQEQFPKILWVHTNKVLDGERMIEHVSARTWMHWGKKSNFEVRIVNNINAYEWLSPEMVQYVKHTKQSSKYGTSAYELLKLALLIEHGGLYLKINEAVMINNFEPIQEQNLQLLLLGHEDEDFFKKNAPEVILFYHNESYIKKYEDEVIYAKKNSKLIRDVMQKVRIILLNGQWPYKDEEGIESVSSGSKVTYIHNIICHTINANHQYLYYDHDQFVHKYKVLSLHSSNNTINRRIQKKEFLDYAIKDENQFFKKFGKVSIVSTKAVILWDILIETFYTSSFQKDHQKSVYAKGIVNTDYNKWMLDYVDLTRPKVSFCIVSLQPIGEFGFKEQINKSVEKLKEQQYKNWQAIYFVQNMQEKFIKFSETPNVTIINSSGFSGLDFQRAAIFYCQPKSIAVVLDYNEYFTKIDALTIANKQFTDVGMYGAYVATLTNDVQYVNVFGTKKIWRIMLQPSQQLYDDVANHFRFVSLQSYRFLSHGNLHDDQNGRYFDTVIPFLTLLQTFYNYEFCYNSELTYHLKRVNKYYEIPKFRLTLNSIVINSPTRKKINMRGFQYFNKYPAYEFCQAVGEFLNYKKRPIEELFVLNNGVEFQGLKARQGKQLLIPKKIHQVWVGGQMPKYKKFIMGKNRQHHPDYEYHLWGNANITKENFPNSYYLILRLIESNKNSTYNKLSMVGDLMKHELLYMNGGFYLDANYMTLRPHSLDTWRTYKAMFVSHYEPRQRLERYSGLIGCVKNFKNFERVVHHSVIGSRDYYSHEASIQAGPFLLSEAVRAQQENDLQIFQPSFDHIYPFAMPYKFLCEAPENLPESQTLFKNKKTYYKNCSDIYYYAFGVDFFAEGLSWLHEKGK